MFRLILISQLLILEAKFTNGYIIDSGQCGIRKVTSRTSRIINGNESDPGSWPWQVLMKHDDNLNCGGTLISNNYILTAAHCLYASNMKRYSYYLGAQHLNTTKDSQAIEVPAHLIIFHPQYDPDTSAFDICLVRLVNPVEFTSYILPACLPTIETSMNIGDEVYVTGWGNADPSIDFYPPSLQEAKILVINTTMCEEWYLREAIVVPENHFCAGYRDGRTDTCDGDSGGPLVHEETSASDNTAFVLRGVTSFGTTCATKERPGVYVRVSDFTDWMEETMANLSAPACQPIESTACGGSITTPGIIRSPTTSRNLAYPPNQNCEWKIEAPVGETITFNFICYFMLSPQNQDYNDYIMIEDNTGGEPDYYSQNTIPSPHFVNGNSATLTFVTNELFDYPGFVIDIQFSSASSTPEAQVDVTTHSATATDSSKNPMGATSQGSTATTAPMETMASSAPMETMASSTAMETMTSSAPTESTTSNATIIQIYFHVVFISISTSLLMAFGNT